MNLRRWTQLALLSATVAMASNAALGQSNTIRIIIGTAPGGAIDPYARLIADPMAEVLGQSVIIEYKPGAGGANSAQFIAEQPADGQYIRGGTHDFTEIIPNAFTQL